MTSTILVTYLMGEFENSYWNTQTVLSLQNLTFSTKGMIRDFTYSEYSVCINFSDSSNRD